MIPPLNTSQLDAGVVAYLSDCLAAVTVPAPPDADRMPDIIAGVSLEELKINTPTVVVATPSALADCNGVYCDKLQTRIVVVTPMVDGITLAHHQDLFTAVAGCFPARPRGGPAEDLAAWEALQEQLSDAIYAATGDEYRFRGWFSLGDDQGRGERRIEHALVMRLSIVHDSLV